MYYKACTNYFPVLLCTRQLAQNRFQYYFVLQSLHKALPSTTLYYKACTKHFPVLFCTAKLAHSTSQYYFVLQSLHKALPSTTVYYKACTKHFPVLLCTAKLAQSTSQYYFVLQSLHKALPSTAVYYKACTNYFPVLLCTTKLAQNTFQYYFVLQSLHTALPSTTLYYKACTKHFPVLLCTAKLAQRLLPSTTLTKQPWRSHYNAICRDWVAKHNRTTRNGVETCSSKTGSRRQSRKKTILKHFLMIFKRKITSAKSAKICWQITIAAWMQPLQYDLQSSTAKDNSITEAAAAPTKQPWRSHYNAICRDWVAKHNRTTRNGVGNCSSKTGSRRQSRKKTILKHFLKGFLKGKLLVPKVRKSADKSLSQPGCSHPNTIYNLQLQKTIVLRKQPQHQATFMQPFQYDLQAQIQETHRTTHTGTTIVAKHTEGTKRPQLHPPRARGTSHRRLQPLYTEKHKVSCSGFLPHNTRHATFMQPFQCDLQPQLQAKNRTTQTGTTIVAKHIEGTKPFIAGCSHFTRKNTRFRAPASSPKQSPCNIHAAIPMRSASTASRNA